MKRSKTGYLFIAPAVLHLLVFALLPLGYALYLSFFKWNILKGDNPFVGFENYARLFEDTGFWNAMKNSAVYTLFSVPIGMAVALAVALLVSQKLRGMPIFRTLFYMPAISSQVAIAMMWIYIYLPKTGMINTILGGADIDYLNTPGLAMAALVFMSIWTGLGPRMILYLAGIMNIPSALYEAASLDGSTGWHRFWKITLPMLGPTTLFVLITSTIAAMQIFTPVYMMTKGGPQETTDVVGYHIYSTAWERFQIGAASAQSFVLLAIILAISLVQFRLMKKSAEGWGAG